MDFENSISFLLAKVSVAHRNMLQKAVSEVGLHSGQVFVLFELWKTDGQRQIDLADRLNLAPPTVNKILGGLLDGDFVTRAKYEDDARSTRIFLTAKGNDVRERLETQWAELEAETVEGLTDTETLMLRQLLGKLLGQ
ncbi:MAG: winged helix-turn-helix transcriptional regulator [Saprospiraceae bacterium]|nr:winged helix-turn-helix transcriptional regulator [Pyrinomonadaceae bacterium]